MKAVRRNFRTPFTPRERIQTDFTGDDGKTIQEQSENTDINNIIRKFRRTGLIEHVQENEPIYGDVTGYDYQKNMNMIAKINQTFESLPASVRAQFNHDPNIFIHHIENQKNIDDMKDGVIDNPIDLAPVEEQPAQAETTGDEVAKSSPA